MRAQSILADIFVAFFFLLIVLGLVWIFFEHMPEQLSNIREQKSCAEVETVSKFLLEVYNESDIIQEPFLIDYSKFYTRNYTKLLQETGAKSSFRLEYSIYSFNNVQDNTNIIIPNETYPSIHILRDGDNIIVRSGSNTTNMEFRVKLLFPLIKIKSVRNTSRIRYNYVNYSSTSNSKTSYINLRGDVIGGGAYEQVNISLDEEPDLTYIKDTSCTNDCPVYIGSNNSYLKSNLGPGTIFRQKDYCIIKRSGVIQRGEEIYSAQLRILAW